MATTDQIYLAAGLPPRDAARRLADVLGMTLREDGDGVHVYRRSGEGDAVLELGGRVDRNWHHDAARGPHRVPEDASVMDGYDIEWVIHLHPADEDGLHRRTRALFEEATSRLGWPGVLVHDVDTLVAARRPGEPVTQLPPDTSPLAVHQDRWQRFALEGHGSG